MDIAHEQIDTYLNLNPSLRFCLGPEDTPHDITGLEPMPVFTWATSPVHCGQYAGGVLQFNEILDVCGSRHDPPLCATTADRFYCEAKYKLKQYHRTHSGLTAVRGRGNYSPDQLPDGQTVHNCMVMYDGLKGPLRVAGPPKGLDTFLEVSMLPAFRFLFLNHVEFRTQGPQWKITVTQLRETLLKEWLMPPLRVAYLAIAHHLRDRDEQEACLEHAGQTAHDARMIMSLYQACWDFMRSNILAFGEYSQIYYSPGAYSLAARRAQRRSRHFAENEVLRSWEYQVCGRYPDMWNKGDSLPADDAGTRVPDPLVDVEAFLARRDEEWAQELTRMDAEHHARLDERADQRGGLQYPPGQ